MADTDNNLEGFTLEPLTEANADFDGDPTTSTAPRASSMMTDLEAVLVKHIPDPVVSDEVVLSIEHLKKTYNGGKTYVLKDINLDVHKGEVIVFLGPSGCGKSTLLYCINCLEEYQGGTIRMNGEEVNRSEKGLAKLHQKLGMVFQTYDLFPHLTILDNVTLAPRKILNMPKEEAEARAHELLKSVGMDDKAKSYPRMLSGGQKQRVAIARALAMDPEVLLLDEITAALDPESVHDVLAVVQKLAREGKTMLMVTHEMTFALSAATRIVFLEGGYVVEENTPKEFFFHPKTERAAEFLKNFKFNAEAMNG